MRGILTTNYANYTNVFNYPGTVVPPYGAGELR